MTNPPPAHPFDLEVRPGVRVRDLKTKAECESAVLALDLDIGRIKLQIADNETDPHLREPGWRTRAQGAISWKKKTRSAINLFAQSFDIQNDTVARKRRRILDTFRDELGDQEFDRIVAIATERYPELFLGEVARN